MRRIPWNAVKPSTLLDALVASATVLAPSLENDGVARWRPVGDWSDLAPAQRLPLLPPKCWLLPSPERLWEEANGAFIPPAPARELVLLGLSACDLAGIDWLDRAAAEDPLYRQRRIRVHLVGRNCRSAPSCSCPPRLSSPPFDLFFDDDWLWSATAWGDDVLASVAESEVTSTSASPDTGKNGTAPPWPADLEQRFLSGAENPIWQTTAARCLSCGSCSAVCPTCNCFDVVDVAALDGTVQRERIADNCFFREHGLVAGGHNFRPDRTSRLRFRYQHKLLGFGPLQGEVACVGCGRCVRVCPADIDLRTIVAALDTGAGER